MKGDPLSLKIRRWHPMCLSMGVMVLTRARSRLVNRNAVSVVVVCLKGSWVDVVDVVEVEDVVEELKEDEEDEDVEEDAAIFLV